MKQGAEARVEIGDRVKKKRPKKGYRHPELDQRIRERRTEKEKALLKKARRHGVNTPQTTKETSTELRMEHIQGETLGKTLETDALRKTGKQVEKLHEAGITHGDLTPENVLINEEAYLIDFGLSQRSERLEDRAMDLHLFKQTLKSRGKEQAFQDFLKGYRPGFREEVLEKLEEIEGRGRYK